MQEYKKLLFTGLLAILFIPLYGQNTDSPYSRYGYGILNNQSVGASRSMGGISYGVRGINTNPGNPASYSGVDSLTFIFDMGVNYVKSRLSENGETQMNDNGGLDYITMQFPLSRNLGMSIGLLPFSSVGYSFGSVESPNITSSKAFSGSGGISRIYGGLAYRFGQLSVGANVGYLFGNTTYSRNLSITGIPSANGQRWYHKLTLNALKLDFGAQYTIPLNKNDNVIVGAVFSPGIKKSGKIERIYQEFSSSGTLLLSDTAIYRGNDAHADIPNTFGAGFTWNKGKTLVIGADATYQTWSKVRYSEHMDDELNSSNRFNDRWAFNTGFEYTIDPYNRSSFVKRMKFRGGLNYSGSYINVIDNAGNTSGYKEYGATIGVGLPFWDNMSGRVSHINIGLEYRNISPSKKHLIKEQYFGVSVGISLNDLWFFKNKFR